MTTTYATAFSLRNRYQANCDRIREIADACQTENRMRNAAEDAEYNALCQDNQLAVMQLQATAADALRENPNILADANRMLRDNVNANRRTVFQFVRDLVMVSTGEEGGIVPLRVQDILEPLQEGLILNKVGLPFMTGLSGDYIWPMYEAVEATILGEGVELTDTPIVMSKLTAKPERIGVAIPVTRESINQTEGIIERIVKTVMPQAVTVLLNKILFSTEKVTNATSLIGPFVDCKQTATVSAEPTFKELNLLKAQVLETGIDGEALCWVMTKSNKAILESTPKDSGSGIMVCENDTICGLPVYTTNFIGQTHIGLGDWRYQPMGLFGDMTFIVDPYTLARKNAVDFVLNVDYGTVTLRPEAFLLATLE